MWIAIEWTVGKSSKSVLQQYDQGAARWCYSGKFITPTALLIVHVPVEGQKILKRNRKWSKKYWGRRLRMHTSPWWPSNGAGKGLHTFDRMKGKRYLHFNCQKTKTTMELLSLRGRGSQHSITMGLILHHMGSLCLSPLPPLTVHFQSSLLDEINSQGCRKALKIGGHLPPCLPIMLQ